MRSRPYIRAESIHIYEARAFGASIQTFCDAVQPKLERGRRGGDNSAADILRLYLVRPDQEGRFEILKRQLDLRGGLIGMGALDIPEGDLHAIEPIYRDVVASYGYDRWHKAHNLAYARSRRSFEARGVGEQLYGAPGVNSCMALVDDVKTYEPLVRRAAGLSLETSAGNYQHLYSFDRILTGEERHAIQRALVAHAQSLGLGGDMRAIGPAQPHRVPGSINYKEGRGLFVCRLAATWLVPTDGVKPLRADDWIRKGQELAAAEPVKSAEHSNAATALAGPRRRLRRTGGGGDKSDSGDDWAWTCRQVEQSTGKENGDALAQRLERELADRVRHRRGKDAERYARLTVFNVRREKQF